MKRDELNSSKGSSATVNAIDFGSLTDLGIAGAAMQQQSMKQLLACSCFARIFWVQSF